MTAKMSNFVQQIKKYSFNNILDNFTSSHPYILIILHISGVD